MTDKLYEKMPEGALSPAFSAANTEAVAARTAVIAATGAPRVRMTPLAKRMADDMGISIESMFGGGLRSRIFSYDLSCAAVPEPEVVAEPEPEPEIMAVPEPEPEPEIMAEPEPEPEPEIVVAEPEPEPEPEANPEPAYEPGAIFRQKQAAPATESIDKDAMVAAVIAADENVAGVIRMNDARRRISSKTVQSSIKTAAVTQHVETEITELLALQRRLNAEKGTSIPLKAFYIKAAAMCVREKERFRMRLADAEDAYLLTESANIGLQFDTRDGTVVSAFQDADKKTIEEIALEISMLAEKAKRLETADEDQAVCAISLIDKSDSGVCSFTPIINQPESAILGIGSIYTRLVMTGNSIENRQFVMQSLTFDHRIVNGSEADDFQSRLTEILGDPGSLV